MIMVMLKYYIFYYIIGAVALFGIISKMITYSSLKRMVKASSDMAKSDHLFMKMVRQKFEHACMVSDKVQNVGAFVDKYLYEYRILKLRLHSWRQLQKIALWLCVLLGLAAAALEFAYYGMTDTVLRYGVEGVAAAIVQFLLQVAQDENYQLNAAKTYMVDFLENVYARRYEKLYQQKQEPEIKLMPVTEETAKVKAEERPEKEVQASVAETEPQDQETVEEPQEEYPQASAIREILEEFLA